jgi:hypothetical protein
LAGLLPQGLRRLSWSLTHPSNPVNLSHLTQLTFLRVDGSIWENLHSSHLPASLKQLEVGFMVDGLRVVEEQQQRLTGWQLDRLERHDVQRQLTRLQNLQTACVDIPHLRRRAPCAALKQLTSLTSLTLTSVDHEFRDEGWGRRAALATAGSMPSLRRLRLLFQRLPPGLPTPLVALSRLTQLVVSVFWPQDSTVQHRRSWQGVAGSMASLKWLSVPDVLLADGQGWLGGLQQLLVLELRCNGYFWGSDTYTSSMPWLEGCSQQVLPPRLQVLSASGMTADQAVSRQVRRRLQRLVGSSSCEVMVVNDLDKVVDPVQQLAGLPVALQRMLS